MLWLVKYRQVTFNIQSEYKSFSTLNLVYDIDYQSLSSTSQNSDWPLSITAAKFKLMLSECWAELNPLWRKDFFSHFPGTILCFVFPTNVKVNKYLNPWTSCATISPLASMGKWLTTMAQPWSWNRSEVVPCRCTTFIERNDH